MNKEVTRTNNYHAKEIQFISMFVVIFSILFGISLIIIGISSCIRNKENSIVESSNLIEDENSQDYISLGIFRVTAYCGCEKCCEKYGRNRPVDENNNPIVYTASGKKALQGLTIAADKKIYPFGTKLYINGNEFEVQDVGGEIKGNSLDIYFENHLDAVNFGVQYIEVFTKNG